MTLAIDNIESVKATPFPAGRLRDGGIVSVPGLIMVQWRSSEAGKLFQVYVNGRLAGVTADVEQRVLLVQCDHSHPAAIEIVAVEGADKDVDHAGELVGFSRDDGSHVALSWPRLGTLALGSEARVCWNGGAGGIDYDNPIATQTVWADPTEKWGWGLDGFGEVGFGYNGGAVGLGRGAFGLGEFGFDAEMMVFESAALGIGTYLLAVRLADQRGNLDEGDISSVTVSVDPLPATPRLALESYGQVEGLVLNIT